MQIGQFFFVFRPQLRQYVNSSQPYNYITVKLGMSNKRISEQINSRRHFNRVIFKNKMQNP